MTSARTIAATAALLTTLAVPAAAQAPVSIRFPEPGLESITARNAPLRTILAEWSRVGDSRFVNAERITGASLTLELVNVTERKAIETLLRGVSGYIVGARAAAVPGSSTFDRIMILPTTAPIRQAAAAPPLTFSPTPAPFIPSEPDDDTENGTATGARGMPPTLLQQQLREATERAELARQSRERDDSDEDDEEIDEEEEPAAAPAGRPGPNPFGNVQGSARPGEITTAPRRSNRGPEGER